MLSFAVYSKGKPAESVNLAGAYVVGSEDVALRADLGFRDGVITCQKRAAGPAGLALLWMVPDFGEILIETVRLQERAQPYILQVELARGRLLRINQKLEEWGLLDFEDAAPILARSNKARDVLIKALQADTPAQAASFGDQALGAAVQVSEELSRLHAEVLLGRRRQSGGFPRRLFGCAVHLDAPPEASRDRLSAAFDFVTLPLSWRDIEPKEQEFNWKPLDTWIELLTKARMPVKGSALLCFADRHVPDWVHVWEHDFDTIRDLVFEHVRRVINRYGQYIHAWDVVSGIHGNNCFTFNFEQLMELTRMSAALTKQTAPRASAVIDLVAPWGEYYARNQRTIPPLLYADMVVQSGVNFDAFGLQFHFGPGIDGMFVRDMFQISSQLDLFSKLGKPLHVSAVQVPSSTAPAPSAGAAVPPPINGGTWRKPWSEEVQADWLDQFVTIALSKPFVESVTWHSLADHAQQIVPHGGLLRADLVPKQAYNRFLQRRAEIIGPKKAGRAAAG